jgi:hypothetical protein
MRLHLALMLDKITQVEAVGCDSAHEAAWLERNLLERRLPPWNRSPREAQEAEALDWITGEQKVTRAQPGDLDVHGWADGVLVSFEIRDGRLSGWRQRDCGEAAARRYLDQTPPEWAGFARRSAELAVRLR